MKKRIITGICIFVLLVSAILLRQLSTIIFDILIFAVMLAAAGELYYCFTQKEIFPMAIPILVTFAGIVGGYYILGNIGIAVAIFLGFLVACINYLFIKNAPLDTLLTTMFIIVYPMGLLSFALLLNHSFGGFLGIVLTILISMLTDTFAYFIGVTYGKRKLCPEISRNKTVAGFFGGIMGGILGAVLCYVVFQGLGWFANTVDVFYINLSLNTVIWVYIGAGLVGALLTTFGDLFASVLKRRCEVKDFGKIFPGHGGFLDRIDGLMWVIPMVVAIFYIF